MLLLLKLLLSFNRLAIILPKSKYKERIQQKILSIFLNFFFDFLKTNDGSFKIISSQKYQCCINSKKMYKNCRQK